MKKFIAIILATTLLTGCGATEKEAENQKIERKSTPAKEVSVFEVGKDQIKLEIAKTASSNSEYIAQVSAEISGEVTEIEVDVGDIVQTGAKLVNLGDSLSTDQIDLQYQTAQKANQLSEYNKTITQFSGQQNVDAAQLGVVAAEKNYNTAVKNKENTILLFEDQYENAQIAIENAELSYENAQDNLDALEDLLDDTEDELDDIQDQNDPSLAATEAQLKSSINSLESQIRNAELGVKTSENGIRQAELGLEQLMDNYRSQFTQINSAISQAENQYISAVNQLEQASAGAKLQEIGAESQLNQSQSAAESARLNANSKTVKAPIAGRVTEINAEIGNIVSPGQVLVKIENDQIISVKTSLNANEARFIQFGDEVRIEYKGAKVKGTIASISPTLDQTSKKVDVEIELPKTGAIPTGDFVKVFFQVHPRDSFFIPLNSVFLQSNQKYVRVAANGKVKYIEVEIGEIIEDHAEVLTGLKPGDKVITTVESFLSEGEKVSIK